MKRRTVWPTLALACVTVASSLAGAETLQDAVAQAVLTNPEVLAAANRRYAADEGVKQARAGYLPRVDLSVGSGRARLDTQDARFLGLDSSTFPQRDATVSLSQMLFDGFAVRSEVARQTARVDSSAYGVAAIADELALRTVAIYLEVLRRQETVAAALDNLEAHQRIHQQIKVLSEGGVGRRADLDQAESRLALAKSDLRQEQSSLKDAEAAYRRLVGTAPQALALPQASGVSLLPSETAATEAALTGHPAMKSAEADIAFARALQSGAKAALAPRVDLEIANRQTKDIVRGSNTEMSVMLRVRYNFLRGGGDVARVREAGFQVQEANEVLDQTRREIVEGVSQAYNAHLTARERVDLLRQYASASAATRASYAKQFSIGQRTLLDLLNAESEYFNARRAYTSGQFAQLLSQYRIHASMGQLLSYLRITLPLNAVKASRQQSVQGPGLR